MIEKVIASVYSKYANSCVPLENGSNEQIIQKELYSTCVLSRFLFILGQTALCMIVYLEKIANLSKKKTELLAKSKSVEQEQDSMEAEMGMAAAADAEHEKVMLLC
jgi:hypothetical protein